MREEKRPRTALALILLLCLALRLGYNLWVWKHPNMVTGDGYPDTAVWAYEGAVPGPELRVRQGKPVRITVINKLGEDTTVHWHGIRLPNAMDGVPGLTQSQSSRARASSTSSRHPMQAPSGITRTPTHCSSLGAGWRGH